MVSEAVQVLSALGDEGAHDIYRNGQRGFLLLVVSLRIGFYARLYGSGDLWQLLGAVRSVEAQLAERVRIGFELIQRRRRVRLDRIAVAYQRQVIRRR